MAGIITSITNAVRSGSVRKAKRHPLPPIEKAKYDCVKNAVCGYFTVGFGKAEIMPSDIKSKKYYVAGYGSNNPATGVLDPVSAHAVWIDDNSGKSGIVLISVDCVGLLRADVDTINERLNEFKVRTGCRSINVMSTHTHAGIDTMGIWGMLPFSGRRKDYMEIVYNGIKNAVETAYATKRDGDLYYGSVKAVDLQKDHNRLPNVFCETIARLRFVPHDGSADIHMINFAAHPETLGGANSLISADYPCYLRRKIFEETGAETIFFNGALGGMITPILKNPDDKVESTITTGRLLAEQSLTISNERKLSPKVSVLRQDFYVDVENVLIGVASTVKILPAHKIYTGNGTMGMGVVSSLTYIEIDDVKILMIPGEMFPELAYGGYLKAEEAACGGPEMNPKPLCEIAGDENMMIFGLANDELGYIIPPNDFFLNPTKPYLDSVTDHLGRRHYEETNSMSPYFATQIADTFTDMIKTVKGEQ